MAATTSNATIRDGQIIPDHPEEMPRSGRAVITVVEEEWKKPDWEKVKAVLGKVKFRMSGLEYERTVRKEWEEREAKQFRDLP